MTFELALSLSATVGLLVLSALLAGSEKALATVSKTRLQHLEAQGSWRVKQVLRLISDRERTVSALLFATILVNVFASALATFVALAFLPDSGVLAAALSITAILFVFTEVVPRTLLTARTEHFAVSVSGVVGLVVTLLAPIVAALRFVISGVLELFGIKTEEPAPTPTGHEEIRTAIELQHFEGGVEREHRDMLGGVLDLAHLKLSDVMVHRKNMEVLDATAPPQTIVERVLSSTHTRFPLWRDNPENIIGVLHLKVLVRTLMDRKGSLKNLDIAALTAEPWYVPDTTSLEEQLAAFRARREHLALVVDEYGVLQGLVTLEDILEEVFGKMSEGRQQTASDRVRPQADGAYIVDGTMPIRELNRQLRWTLPVDGATTIAGLVINEAQIIPDIGQMFSFFGFKFEVVRRQRNQITAIRIVPPAPDADEFAANTG
jgi:Mg2+/Co2+ transporter CorB